MSSPLYNPHSESSPINPLNNDDEFDPLWVQRMGRDMSKNKASSSTARSESSDATEAVLVDVLLNKWKNVATPLCSQRQESSSEIKERELEMEYLRRQNQVELE
ncbi:hypothetical protein Tco_0819256 [Tanacetum coccineum]|uniref:Uncharacterized protein n=1 Tax=Tanacetum coccineum TaxID=301880 RepID=A0ABQ5A8X5_9ASTR